MWKAVKYIYLIAFTSIGGAIMAGDWGWIAGALLAAVGGLFGFWSFYNPAAQGRAVETTKSSPARLGDKGRNALKKVLAKHRGTNGIYYGGARIKSVLIAPIVGAFLGFMVGGVGLTFCSIPLISFVMSPWAPQSWAVFREYDPDGGAVLTGTAPELIAVAIFIGAGTCAVIGAIDCTILEISSRLGTVKESGDENERKDSRDHIDEAKDR